MESETAPRPFSWAFGIFKFAQCCYTAGPSAEAQAEAFTADSQTDVKEDDPEKMISNVQLSEQGMQTPTKAPSSLVAPQLPLPKPTTTVTPPQEETSAKELVKLQSTDTSKIPRNDVQTVPPPKEEPPILMHRVSSADFQTSLCQGRLSEFSLASLSTGVMDDAAA